MREIHAPVPGLNKKMGSQIERFFDKLQPGKLVVRMNSTIMDSPLLFQPEKGSKIGADNEATPFLAPYFEEIDAANAGERLLLRMERQTLRRLSATGAVVFTIHTYQMRLPEVAADGTLSQRVEAHYRSLLGTEMEGYKSHAAAFCDWLAGARLENQ